MNRFWISAVYKKTCHICGKPFQSAAHNAKHCSPTCKLESRRRRRIANRGPLRTSTKTCVQCSVSFETRSAIKKYCSQACYRLATAERKRFERGTRGRKTGKNRVETGFRGLCSVCGVDNVLVSECPECGYPCCVKCSDESGHCNLCSVEPVVPVLVNAV